MTRKSFTGFSLGAVFLAGIAVLGLFALLLMTRTMHVKPENNSPSAENTKIHGQVIYDQRAALPPQAMLVVQLAERERTSNLQKIIAENRLKITDHVPLDFTLPVTTGQLDKNFFYALQAKISVGDALWYVNETPMPVEPGRAGYLIRLTTVEDGSAEIADKNDIKGREWLAEDIFNNGIIDNSRITLFIENKAKPDPAGDIAKHYNASGSGGCNRYFTTATLNENDNTLAFGTPGMTFMACAEAISTQEARFVDMLSKVRAYRINERGILYLLDENRTPLSRFASGD